MFRFIPSIFLLVFASLTQLTSYAFVGSLKPNLTLVVLLVISIIYKDWLRRATLIFLAALLLKFGQGLEVQNVMFILSALLGIFLIDRIPSIKFVNLVLAVIVSTLTINITNFEAWTVFTEMLYNLIVALLLFTIYRLWLGKYEKNQ